jgi:hypothetical protein
MGNMKHCKYCASTVTRLDSFGYCKKYACFDRSGQKEKLEALIKRAGDIYTMPDTWGQIGRVVSNPYSHRHRKTDDIKWDAKREFGFIPLEVLNRIPLKYQDSKWDKNIRW